MNGSSIYFLNNNSAVQQSIEQGFIKGQIQYIIFFIRMSSQNNPYPDLTNQPLVINQNNPQVGNAYYPPPNNYGGYIPPPIYPQGANYPPPPPAYNGYNQNPNYVPANQVFSNQGYNPNNQGFIPIHGGKLVCPICRRETDNFPRKVPGGVTWIWCFGLFIFTGLCCCIPFCVDSCQDTQLVCVICLCVKARQEANCC